MIMKTLLALIKREILEHKSIWKIPAILLGIGVLIKISMSAGNLSVNIDTPDFLQLDGVINNTLDSVVTRALGFMNSLVSFVMLLVAVFYALACLYNERQDESILFWRSMPISDGLTVASKLLIALVLVPLLIIVCQFFMSVVFLGTDTIVYVTNYLSHSAENIIKMMMWLMLPIISWCLLCSEIAKKNPFLLAFVAPVIVIFVDKLFFDTGLSGLIMDRFSSKSHDSSLLLITGIGFSAVCIFMATIKRSQRI